MGKKRRPKKKKKKDKKTLLLHPESTKSQSGSGSTPQETKLVDKGESFRQSSVTPGQNRGQLHIDPAQIGQVALRFASEMDSCTTTTHTTPMGRVNLQFSAVHNNEFVSPSTMMRKLPSTE